MTANPRLQATRIRPRAPELERWQRMNCQISHSRYRHRILEVVVFIVALVDCTPKGEEAKKQLELKRA